MNAREFVLGALVSINAVAFPADKIKLNLSRVDGCSLDCGEKDQSTVMVLTPKRHSDGQRKGAIPSKKYPTYVYDKPVALLVVENQENHPIDVWDLNETSWFVEIETERESHKSGLMLPAASCSTSHIRRIPPHGKVVLLVGRPSTWARYKMRIGYHCPMCGLAVERQGDFNGKAYVLQYTNWLSVDNPPKDDVAATARDKSLKMSLLRLDNNIRNENLDNVLCFDSQGRRKFVDCVVLLENKNDFPIRLGGLNNGNWKVVANSRDGIKSNYHPFPMSQDEKTWTVFLSAWETLAVPLVIEIDLADYKILESLQLEYSVNGERAETVMRFDSSDRVSIDLLDRMSKGVLEI